MPCEITGALPDVSGHRIARGGPGNRWAYMVYMSERCAVKGPRSFLIGFCGTNAATENDTAKSGHFGPATFLYRTYFLQPTRLKHNFIHLLEQRRRPVAGALPKNID
jgi:hypothetical protein